MPWVWLGAAIAMEVVGTVCLKQSAGLTRLLPALGVVVGYVSCFVLLAQALRTFEVGTAYALWSGIGTVLVVVAGVVLFDESVRPLTVAGIALVVAGVAVLNLAGGH